MNAVPPSPRGLPFFVGIFTNEERCVTLSVDGIIDCDIDDCGVGDVIKGERYVTFSVDGIDCDIFNSGVGDVIKGEGTWTSVLPPNLELFPSNMAVLQLGDSLPLLSISNTVDLILGDLRSENLGLSTLFFFGDGEVVSIKINKNH